MTDDARDLTSVVDDEEAIQLADAAQADEPREAGGRVDQENQTPLGDRQEEIDQQIEDAIRQLSEQRHSSVYPLLLGENDLDNDSVDDVFDDLRLRELPKDEQLEVIVHSGGGSIHAAYNLALLFRKFARQQLTFIVPRWAKSAATLLVCAGDEILMGPIAELGPVDPQITTMNPLERRFEQVSPLSIEATLDLIRSEFRGGHESLAKGLLERLQFPMTLGGFKRSLEIGKVYLQRLLASRMLSGKDAKQRAEKVSHELVEGYADHGYCIDVEEARRIGLNATELTGDDFELVWNLYRLAEERERISKQQKRQKMEDLLKMIPSDARPS